MKLSHNKFLLLLVFSFSFSFFASKANQIDSLNKFLESRRSPNPPRDAPWTVQLSDDHSPVFVGNQEGLKKGDKISTLPGQPGFAAFDQYGGYVTVDPQAGRALFYYFAESAHNASSKPLVLWLNGGPGCSSFGYGAMEELGPFRVKSDGETLFKNPYAWNKVANVLFLDSPAGVGFSYSNTTSDYNNVGDNRTAADSYIFLMNWLERFPEYKTRDFYITGESYAGHYVPQLAYTILSRNKVTKQTVINLKGVAIGNPWIDDLTGTIGMYDYFWTHALISDETIAGIHKYCDFVTSSIECGDSLTQADKDTENIDIYNIYAPLCNSSLTKPRPTGSVHNFDPCTDNYVIKYLNRKEVQQALHAKPKEWEFCSGVGWSDSPTTILPVIKQLIASGINVSIYSGDTDGRVPVTSSRYSINTLNLSVATPWRPWFSNNEVGGYVVEYKGLTLTTVRGAGHTVPSYQPERALTMISSFLQGKLPPSS